MAAANQAVLARLGEGLRQGRGLVAVVGAQASADSGIPNLSELTTDLLREIDVREIGGSERRSWETSLKEAEPAKLLALLESEVSSSAFESFLRDRFHSAKPTAVHEHLVRLPLTAIITSNLDTLLEQALDSAGVPFHVIGPDLKSLVSMRENEIPVFKLRGSIDPLRWTPKDLRSEFSVAQDVFWNIVRSLLLANIALLVGFSLTSGALGQLFEDFATLELSRRNWFYVGPLANEPLLALWEKRGLNCLQARNRSDLLRILRRIQRFGHSDQSSLGIGGLQTSHTKAVATRSIVLFGNQRSPLIRSVERQLRHRQSITVQRATEIHIGESAVDSLEKIVSGATEAMVVLADDTPSIDRLRSSRARQNLAFEIGYLVGTLGKDKVLIVTDNPADLHSDYGGVRIVFLDRGHPRLLEKALDSWLDDY